MYVIMFCCLSDLFLQYSNLSEQFLFLQVIGCIGKVTLTRWLLGG